MFKNSIIIKPDDIDLILSWLEKKPKRVELLLNSKIDGDLNKTFYKKCLNKYPTMIFIKTTENIRFGGYISVTWPEEFNKRDDKSFIFSLDKGKKYKIKEEEKENAINYCEDVSFCFGAGCDLYIRNKCTSRDNNRVGYASYDLPKDYEINNGKIYFRVLSHEVYHILY